VQNLTASDKPAPKRPKAGTKTGRVWEIADEISALIGQTAESKSVRERYVAEGGDPGTASVQYGHWKRARAETREVLPNAPPSQNKTPRSVEKVVPREEPPDWTILLKNEFKYFADWGLDGNERILTDKKLPSERGVYAFVIQDRVVYIGVSTSLSRRMNNYRVGAKGQRTSRRLNEKLSGVIREGKAVRVLFATPGMGSWNNLPIDLAPGLEAGLIALFRPEWNMRGIGGQDD